MPSSHVTGQPLACRPGLPQALGADFAVAARLQVVAQAVALKVVAQQQFAAEGGIRAVDLVRGHRGAVDHAAAGAFAPAGIAQIGQVIGRQSGVGAGNGAQGGFVQALGGAVGLCHGFQRLFAAFWGSLLV